MPTTFVLDDREMPEAAVDHQRSRVICRVGRLDRVRMPRHPVRDRALPSLPGGDRLHDVTLGEDRERARHPRARQRRPRSARPSAAQPRRASPGPRSPAGSASYGRRRAARGDSSDLVWTARCGWPDSRDGTLPLRRRHLRGTWPDAGHPALPLRRVPAGRAGTSVRSSATLAGDLVILDRRCARGGSTARRATARAAWLLRRCGSSLFWGSGSRADSIAAERSTVRPASGSQGTSTRTRRGTTTNGPDDGLPRDGRRARSEIRWS